MNLSVNLSNEEIEQLRLVTAASDDAEAVSKAAREYLRLVRLRELKSVSGKVEYDNNWQQLEATEIEHTDFPI